MKTKYPKTQAEIPNKSNGPTKVKWVVFLCLLLLFSILNFLITQGNSAQLFCTLGTITGPMTGAIARGFQDCCLKLSLLLMAYSGPVLFLGVALQYIRLPDKKWLSVIKMIAWIVAWLVWFASGILSFGHALS